MITSFNHSLPSIPVALQEPVIPLADDHLDEFPRLSQSSAIYLGRLQAWQDVRSSIPLVFLDGLAVAIALVAVSSLENLLSPTPLAFDIKFAAGAVVMTLLFQLLHGLYPACGMSYSREFCKILLTCLTSGVSVAFAMVCRDPTLSAAWFGAPAFSLLLAVLLCGFRPLGRKLLADYDWWAQPVAVIGNSSRALDIAERLNSSRHEGLRAIGVIFDPHRHWESACNSRNRCYLGPVSELEDILIRTSTCRLMVADRDQSSGWDFHSFHGIPHVSLPTDLSHHPIESSQLTESNGCVQVSCRTCLTSPCSLLCKRILDIALILLASPIWLPAMLVIAATIRCTDPGPILYSQSRVGRYKQPFKALKFRSMVLNADVHLRECLETHSELKAEWEATHKLKADPRITPVGRFLRKTSLDELPQLFNVLAGEMSLVGPRPIIDCNDYDSEYIKDHPEVFALYQMVRPGLTGLWQISGRNMLPYKQRVHLDRYYLHNWTIGLDLFILWRTFKTALLREGAC